MKSSIFLVPVQLRNGRATVKRYDKSKDAGGFSKRNKSDMLKIPVLNDTHKSVPGMPIFGSFAEAYEVCNLITDNTFFVEKAELAERMRIAINQVAMKSFANSIVTSSNVQLHKDR